MRLLHITMTVVAALLSVATVSADESKALRKVARDTTVCGVSVREAQLERKAGTMNVNMNLELDDFALKGERVVVFSPLIVNDADTVRMSAVGLYSRTRWFQYLRAGEKPLGGDDEQSVRYSKRPSAVSLSGSVPYESWMNGAELVLERCDYGCCRMLVDEDAASLINYKEVSYSPVYRYVSTEVERVKTRELAGRAYIDFPVNRTEIYPDYRKNPVELAKIIATIDSVRNDSDVTVKRITIKGYASPESPYDNNTRLAKGRTATLKRYVQNLYHFDDDFIATDYEPEDWDGLRAYVVQSDLTHRDEILAIIDDPTLEPDTKDWRMKLRYQDDYAILLQTVYPALRHSDYTIEYVVRGFSDPVEIERLLHTKPQKLSLDEMFLLARTYEEGSDKYNEVFDIAVRMYPDNAAANINAANAAMASGDMKSAEKYLSRAGDSPEAVYARGMFKGLQGDYSAALELVKEAAAAGLEGTETMQTNLEEVRGYVFN